MVAPNVRDFGELERQLHGWLGARMPAASDLRFSDFTYPRGAGRSHETILFDLAWTESGRERTSGLAVRIKPTTFTVFLDDMFYEQYCVIRALHEDGTVPVPKALWYEPDPTVLGAPFFVMERLRGRVAVSAPSYLETGWVVDATPAQRERMWRNGIEAMARLQKVPLARLEVLAPPEGMTGFAFEWDRWDRFMKAMVRADRPLEDHHHWSSVLHATMPADPTPGLVWGDARIGNIMVDDRFDVVALLDWEQPSLGGALHDLGWWLFNQRTKVTSRGGDALPGMPDRQTTIDIWQDASGIRADGIEWYEAFAAFKQACLGVNMLDLWKRELPSEDHPGIAALREMIRALEGR
jgi:aminoglycoside phosphotransferase (APT) family kinase protein